MAKQDYYDCLGVSRDADAAELKKVYRKLAMQYHPDRNQDDAEAEKRFKEVSEAYDVVGDPKQRKEYDSARDMFAGGGFRPGVTYGETDEFGYRAVKDVATVHDFHATILHLLGLDHERLTYYHNGFERRLTDVHGHVIKDVLA